MTLPRRRRISLALITRPAGRVNVLPRFTDFQRNKPVSTGRTRPCRSCIRNKGKRIHGLSLRPLGNFPALVREREPLDFRLSVVCYMRPIGLVVSDFFSFYSRSQPFRRCFARCCCREEHRSTGFGVFRTGVSAASDFRFVGNFGAVVSDW